MDATTRQIVQAAAAAEKARVQAGTALLEGPQQPAQQQSGQQQQPAAGQKRRRGDAAAAAAASSAAAVAVPSNEAEADALITKIMSGELWPKYHQQ
jgi:hypothetical protein